MTGPTFSVVVPAYKTEDVVADLIAAMLAQTRSDWELVIVDDCSPDDLALAVEPYLQDARIRLVRLPQNRGVSGARNEGIRAARGELVSFVDSDDVVVPHFLQTVADAFAARPSTGIFGVVPAVTGEDGRPCDLPGLGAPRPASPDDRDAWLRTLLENPFHYKGTTVPRSLLNEIEGFDEQLWLGEDLEFWIRAVLCGRAVTVLDEPAYVHRLIGPSLTRQPDKTLERALAHLETLEHIEADLPATSPWTEILENARRSPLALEATGRFRHAVRAGDVRSARHHARTMVALDPQPRSRLMWAVSHTTPAPLLQAAYSAKRWCQGRPPV